jgi:phosphotriesterase-related protein
MRVETARGAMAVDGLGTTLIHEHVFVLTPDVMQNYGHKWRWDEQDQGADAVRQPQGLNIIVATWLYTFDEIPHFFHYRSPGTILDGPELMTELFVNDIWHGMAARA